MTVLGYTAKDSLLDLFDLAATSSSKTRNNVNELEKSSARESLISLEINDTIGSKEGKALAQLLRSNDKEQYSMREQTEVSAKRESCVWYWKDGNDWVLYEYSLRLQSNHMDLNSVSCDFPGNGEVTSKNSTFQVPQKNCHHGVEFCAEEEKHYDYREDQRHSLRNSPNPTEKREGGIIKQSSMVVPICIGLRETEKGTFIPETFQDRPSSSSLPQKVHFASVIRILPIRPLWAMSAEDRSNYWWQIEDFRHFRKEICLLARPKEDEAKACSLLLLEQGQNFSSNLAQYNSPQRKEQNYDEKEWWHKYGDSRRGLEKFAHSSEQQQIMDSCALAIRMVLTEQRYQEIESDRCCFFGSTMNIKQKEEKRKRLAQIYEDYSSWSKDLALAAAASDEDAVQTDFDDSKRKTREFFLLKQHFHDKKGVHKHMPKFMLPKCCISGKG